MEFIWKFAKFSTTKSLKYKTLKNMGENCQKSKIWRWLKNGWKKGEINSSFQDYSVHFARKMFENGSSLSKSALGLIRRSRTNRIHGTRNQDATRPTRTRKNKKPEGIWVFFDLWCYSRYQNKIHFALCKRALSPARNVLKDTSHQTWPQNRCGLCFFPYRQHELDYTSINRIDFGGSKQPNPW